jgi:hypothetical protein
MRKKRPKIIRITIFMTLLLFLYCPNEPASAQTPANPNGQIGVLFILDNSGSMANNDPGHLRITAARLFTSLLDEGDSVGAVVFSDTAEALTVKMTQIQTPADKDRLAGLFQPITADGYTDVKAAFETAQSILENSPDLPSETVVVFLTDGEPEPLTPTPTYEADTLAVAQSLGLPVLSIALTPGAATPFLIRLSTETKGQVLQARTAMDILDTYLQILSRLKGRTIIGEGQTTAPEAVEINIDPGLLPYLNSISFVVSKEFQTTVTLGDPEGLEIAKNDHRLAFLQTEDDRFTIYTLNDISSGAWTVSLSGTGTAQVRAILNASLRAQFLRPNAFAEAGAPLLIAVQVIETQQQGDPIPMVGTAQFSALITTPTGRQESLDQFYDDGTHGDILAGDGIYSRTYANTQESGSYAIVLTGKKDLVPLQAQTQVTLIDFPEMTLLSPVQSLVTLDKGSTLPVIVTFNLDGPDSGNVVAEMSNPAGAQTGIPLTCQDDECSGSFVPEESGTHTLSIWVEGGIYQSLPYTHTLTQSLEINLIPKISISVEDGDLNLGWVEKEEFAEGITTKLTFTSTADYPVRLDLTLENTSGLVITEPVNLTIPANTQTTLAFTLQAELGAVTGEVHPILLLTSDETISLENNTLPFTLTVFEPTISIEQQTPLHWTTPQGIWFWESQMHFTVHNTSLQTETVTVEIAPESTLHLVQEEITIVPGYQTIRLTLQGKGTILKEETEINLALVPQRSGVTIGTPMPAATVLTIPSLLARSRRMLLWGVPLLIAVLITGKAALRSLRKKIRKPIVTGTLQYWPIHKPHKIASIDLTDFDQQALSLGSDINCDIPLNMPELSPRHLILSVSNESGQMHIILTPRGTTHQGYANLVGPTTLNNETVFEIGTHRFRYLSDSGY